MSSILRSALAVVVMSSCAAQRWPGMSDGGGVAPDDDASQIRRVIRARFDAYARKDAVGWGKFVADDCCCGLGTKQAIQGEIASRPDVFRNWYGDVSAFESHVYGEGAGQTAVVKYRVVEHSELGEQHLRFDQWRHETYVRRDGAWVLVSGVETVIDADPVAVRVEATVLRGLAGEYEYTPGMVDRVTVEGDRLYVQATGQAREELFAESETTFFAKGQPWRMVFERDEAGGAVARARFVMRGQGLEAKRK